MKSKTKVIILNVLDTIIFLPIYLFDMVYISFNRDVREWVETLALKWIMVFDESEIKIWEKATNSLKKLFIVKHFYSINEWAIRHGIVDKSIYGNGNPSKEEKIQMICNEIFLRGSGKIKSVRG